MDSDDDALVEAWLRYNSVQDSKSENDPDYWAIQELIDLVLEDRDHAWTIAVELASRSNTDWQLVMVGCGVLEDLLHLNPDRYFPLLEAAIPKTRKLLVAASCVWIDEPSRSRLDAILGAYGQARHP